MNREQKAAVIAQLHDKVSHAAATFVVGYRGLTVGQLHSLRTGLRKVGGEFKVAKARLIKKAVSQMGNDAFDKYQEHLHDQIGIVFADKEAPAVAKALHDFSKDNAAFTIVAGTLETTLLNKNGVERIASLPSREQLLAQLCGLLQAPAARLAGVLNELVARPVRLLKQIEESKQ
jgi:large subunit ribosomal protein L10